MREFAFAALAAAVLGGCPPPPPVTPQKPPVTSAPEDSIGVATMLPDGTIQLQLRATGAGGTVGDALLTYPPDHKRYQEILTHLGGLKPGESKPVRPFPPEK